MGSRRERETPRGIRARDDAGSGLVTAGRAGRREGDGKASTGSTAVQLVWARLGLRGGGSSSGRHKLESGFDGARRERRALCACDCCCFAGDLWQSERSEDRSGDVGLRWIEHGLNLLERKMETVEC